MLQTYFKKDGMQQFFVVSTDGELDMGYQSQLFQCQTVPYFLSYEARELNGSLEIYYRLLSKMTVRSAIGHLPLTFYRLQNMLDCIIGAMETAEEYLLDADNILWRTDSVFLDPESGRLEFCYCPVKDEVYGSLKDFLSEVIRAVDKKEEKAVLLILKFYDQITEPDCTLDKLRGFRSDYFADTQGLPKKKTAEAYSMDHAVGSDIEKPEKKRSNIEEEKEEKPIGEQVVWLTLIAVAVVNLVLVACLFSGILAYDNVSYLFFGLGVMIVLTLVYMQMTKEASPDTIMQEYFEAQNKEWDEVQVMRENGVGKLGREAGKQQNPIRLEKEQEIYLKQYQDVAQKMLQKKGAVVPEMTSHREPLGQTSVLVTQDRQQIIIEEEEQSLCLEALEKDKYPPIHVTGSSVVLGCMAESCDYILAARGVSRMHAKIMERTDGMYLLDLNSTNGTYLNGEMIESGKDYKLEEGDMVTFAQSEFYVARKRAV